MDEIIEEFKETADRFLLDLKTALTAAKPIPKPGQTVADVVVETTQDFIKRFMNDLPR